ncbi:MAG: methyltransferase [Candidatus Omnitrophica bacterium]|nr:methyltransferase [Candidatus Omnitrophota bacterium]
MKSRERVRRTLEFENPDRPPFELWVLPWTHLHYPEELEEIQKSFPSDFAGPPLEYRQKPATQGNPHRIGSYVDEWGCEFTNIQDGVIGEVKTPLILDWEQDVEKVHFPREWLTFDRGLVNEFCRSTDLYVRAGCCPRPFEQLQFLRGTENLYMDLADPPKEFQQFLNKMHSFYCELLEEWAKTEVDSVMIMDDWGAQKSLLISPRSWRQLFKPLYKDYIDIAHSRGKTVFMHSDGHILGIIPDLIELGLDALNSQVFCMGLDRLAAFKGQITFWGEIDRQRLLPEGSLQEIRQAVSDFHQALYDSGGVIAQCEFGLAAKPQNVREVFKAWRDNFSL